MDDNLLINETARHLNGELLNEAENSDITRNFIRKTFGIDTKPVKADGQFHEVYNQPNYKIKDPILAPLFEKYSISIKAGGDEDGNASIMVEQSYEHAGGGRNGKTTRFDTRDGGKTWKTQ